MLPRAKGCKGSYRGKHQNARRHAASRGESRDKPLPAGLFSEGIAASRTLQSTLSTVGQYQPASKCLPRRSLYYYYALISQEGKKLGRYLMPHLACRRQCGDVRIAVSRGRWLAGANALGLTLAWPVSCLSIMSSKSRNLRQETMLCPAESWVLESSERDPALCAPAGTLLTGNRSHSLLVCWPHLRSSACPGANPIPLRPPIEPCCDCDGSSFLNSKSLP